MCGFVGFVDNKLTASEADRILSAMSEYIVHRGPNDSGAWFDSDLGVSLSHRRLSILDLSAAGHQPMTSDSGRYVISFNGEIYNHLDIRKELEHDSVIKWGGHSDTETLLKSIQKFGLNKTLSKCQGMFAFVLFDRETEKLFLVRDRIGEKPLYYGWQGDSFIFGSQLSALRQHPNFEADIDRNSLTLLLRHNYIPAPYSIYKGVSKLLPGHIFVLDVNNHESKLECYWDVSKIAFNAPKSDKPETSLINELECVLKSSIKDQMISDVPLGAFLSGGVDSSTIVALMQSQSNVPIKTFSIGFYEEGYNEAEHAKAVAEHLGTDHTELYVTAEDALDVVPKLAQLYDEPFSDSSQIPTYLVSKMARKQVTVSLSGDAGDELYCGYNRYAFTNSLWSYISKVPIFLRKMISQLILSIDVNSWNRLNLFLSKSYKVSNLGDKMYKAAEVLCADSIDTLYLGLVSHWKKPESIVLGASEPLTAITDPLRKPELSDPIERMMALDILSYLPDDILAKVDRAAMGVSLETRVPFLNHKVVEHAWKIPKSLKLKNGVGKYCLRQVLYKYVPKELIERPKMGFGVPIGEWLRGPLKDWANELLDSERLVQEGFFDSRAISTMWHEHLSGKRDWQYHLWDILMFQSWYEDHHK